MNKKMFIICALFVLISSCKTDESKEEKSLENILDDIGLEVEKLVQADEAPKQAGNKDGGAGAAQAGAGVVGEAGGGAVAVGAGAGGGGAGDNIKKKIEELKNKIEKANSQNTSIGTYRKYEEEVQKLREELKKGNGNGGNSEDELKQLEDSLKKKKGDRKKALEESKKKFEEFKKQVAAATGVTEGDRVQNQRPIGQQAFRYAQQLGLRVDTAKYGSDTSKLVSHIIEEAIKKIDKALKE
ncbi:ErpL protein [Borreliella lusitaniae]|uniref:ErpL protein n=1 Tax=Borreliella lusitaniae TaxID=100177 RepID=UPI003AB36EC1